MRVVIQRVKKASVTINDAINGEINNGLLLFVGFEEFDSQEDIDWLVGKVIRLRIFDDSEGVMNRSIEEIHGEFLVVSQFTLHAKTKKGNRPSYIKAAEPKVAVPLYNNFIESLKKQSGLKVAEGIFGAKMNVSLENDGPVTIFIDTKNKE